MTWFPSGRDNSSSGWKFDIVSIVAVIGEYTIERHVQLLTSSRMSYLPRLLPAPQVLLKTERPSRLPPVKGVQVFGVCSGTYVSELNFFADVIHKIEEVKEYEFRKYIIEYSKPTDSEKQHTMHMHLNPKADDNNTHWNNNAHPDVERGHHNTRTRFNLPWRPKEPRNTTPANEEEILINNRLQWKSILTIVTFVSVLMLIGLFVWAACIHDGVAMIALGTVSLSTSIACLANSWRPTLTPRKNNSKVPPGNVVIRNRAGGFIFVQCREEITRELYTSPDKCKYDFEGEYLRSMLGTSTVLLMASIIFFSNCSWTMQTAIGMAYIILNMMYWIIPFMMKDIDTWDLSRYDIKPVGEPKKLPDYTQALWCAVWETKSIDWIKSHKIAPPTPAWDEWLRVALEKAREGDEHWDAVQFKNQLMNKA